MGIFSFSPLTLASFHFSAICKASSENHYIFLAFFLLGMILIIASYTMSWEKESEVAESFPTLCDPMNCGLLDSSVHGIFQARVLEWVAITFSRGPSWCRDQTLVSCIVGRCFYHLSHQGSPKSLPVVLQVLSLSDLIPWIYLSLPLHNHKGFDLGHTWMV